MARGINLAIAWGFTTFRVATDSRTVLNWLNSTVDARERVRTKSAGEMLIKSRLQVIRQVIAEFKLAVTVHYVTSAENRADCLTRVPARWLRHEELMPARAPTAGVCAAARSEMTDLEAIGLAHLPHHLGVDRTAYLVEKIKPGVARSVVRRELARCEPCQRIDPAPRVENHVVGGDLAVESNWTRVPADITHLGSHIFLSMVDCWPSRFTIWRRLTSETASSISAQLKQVDIERGPFEELLLDNSTAFRSATVQQFADEWGIRLRFRAAYAPSGNGIVERNHRTIKRIAARGDITPEVATFWYNVTPRRDSDQSSVLSGQVSGYEWRLPLATKSCSDEDPTDPAVWTVGEQVWVRPSVPSCTQKWRQGRITGVISDHTVEVDGVPRHVRHLRKCSRGFNFKSYEESDWTEFDDEDTGAIELEEEPQQVDTPAIEVLEDDTEANVEEAAREEEAAPALERVKIPRQL